MKKSEQDIKAAKDKEDFHGELASYKKVAFQSAFLCILLGGVYFTVVYSIIMPRSQQVMPIDSKSIIRFNLIHMLLMGAVIYFMMKIQLKPIEKVQADLMEKQRRIRFITEHMGDGIWELDMSEEGQYFTTAWAKILGYEAGEWDHRLDSLKAMIPPEDLQPMLDTLQAHIEGKTSEYITTYRCRAKSGEYKSFLSKGKIFETKDGKPISMLGIHTDISESKKVEELTQRTNYYYHNMFENSNSIMILTDPDTGKIIAANKEACRFYGYPKEKLTTMNIMEINPMPLEELLDAVKVLYEQGEGHMFFQHRLANGEIRDVEVYTTNMEIQEKVYFYSIIHDITEQRTAQRALKDSEERYKSLVELLPDALFVFEDRKISFANQEGIKLLGAERVDQILGKDVFQFIHPEFMEEAKLRDYMLYEEKKEVSLAAHQIIQLDGTSIDVESCGKNISYNGGTAILSIVRDIRKRKQVEELLLKIMRENEELLRSVLEYDRLKTEFFSNISHELKTPLNIILGTMQLLHTMYHNHEIYSPHLDLTKYMEMMKQNCYRLLRLFNNLIDVSQFDYGMGKVTLQNCNIVAVVEDITLSVAQYVEDKGISLVFDTDVEEKLMACDVDKIERVMLNLFSNAVKFIQGNGNIWVNIQDQEEGIMIRVKDTGIGIPEDKQHIIFERFRQADSLYSRSREGSGIGLSLVKSIVEAHGGEIFLQSQVGLGSEFIILLPSRLVEGQEWELNEVAATKQNNVERIIIEFSDIYS